MHYIRPHNRRSIRNAARVCAVGSAVMLTISLMAHMQPAQAAATNAGAAQVVQPAGTNKGQPINSGDSNTDFTLKLPSGAACAGDSTNDGYKLQTFIVPSSVDPASLKFGSQGPTPGGTGSNFKAALYDTNGSPYVNKQTIDKTPPGTTGPVPELPAFDYAVWTPGDIGPGTYNVGVACTKGPSSDANQLDRFWVVQMTFATAASGQGGPAQVTWTANNGSSTTTAPTTTPTTAPPTPTTAPPTPTTAPPTPTTAPPTPTTAPTNTTAPTTTPTTSPTSSSSSTSTPSNNGTTSTTVASSSATLSSTSGQPGGSVTVTASGFQPNSAAQIYFFSDPVLLASPTANASGVVQATVTIPANAAAGTHTIEVRGTGASGVALTRSATFSVTSSLPRTGQDFLDLIVWALALLAFGRLALVYGRPHAQRRNAQS